jgi:hypothetical protein
MLDTIGGANMVQGTATNYTTDRFGCLESALALNGGYTTVPTGVYFNTPQFTISVWVYPQNIGTGARLIDFGNGPSSDNVLFALSGLANIPVPYLCIYSGKTAKVQYTSPTNLTMSIWQLLAVTYNGKNSQMFVDGVLVANKSIIYAMKSISRNSCYIGKSNWNNGYSWSYFDDLRFYNVSLTQSQIVELMSQNKSGLNYFENKFYLYFIIDFYFWFSQILLVLQQRQQQRQRQLQQLQQRQRL